MLSSALDHVHASREESVLRLVELLRIPSISTLPEYQSRVQQAAAWLAAELEAAGMEHVQAIQTEGNPLIYADWLNAGTSRPTILFYGHYDVQPVDPLDLWKTPPFEPSIRDGSIYARGATDDKGQVVMQVRALTSMLSSGGELPVNARVIFEGEEETGSLSLSRFVPCNRELLATDSILISDSSFILPDRPSIPYSVRGIASAEVHVRGPKTDLHSGGYGGTVRNPAAALAAIIAAMHDEQGRVQVPGFYDRVRAVSEEEREALRRVPYTLRDWQTATGLEKPWGEAGYSLIEQTGVRPTCEVNGMWSGFQGEGSKTIIPAEAHAKFTMRLVPDQDPDEIAQLFADYVASLAPDSLQVAVELPRDNCWPAVTPIDSPEIRAASAVYETVWGIPPVLVPGGGSIPIVAAFQRELQASVVMMGFGLPDSGVHAPNECFNLTQYQRGIEALVRYCYLLAEADDSAL